MNKTYIFLLALILLIASNKALLDKVQSWQREKRMGMRLGGGIAMIALGIIIFFL